MISADFAAIFLASLAGEVDLTLCVKDGGVKTKFIKLFIKPLRRLTPPAPLKGRPVWFFLTLRHDVGIVPYEVVPLSSLA